MSQNTHPCDTDPTLLSIEEALQRILQDIDPISDSEAIALKQAVDRVLGQPLASPVAVPPERVSAMDGYAVNYADLPASAPFSLPLAGKSLAGHPFCGELQPGQAVRITTGAVVPPGTDTIIIQEVTRLNDQQLRVEQMPAKGQYVRAPGSDIAEGACLLAAHTRLTPAALGLAAAAGNSTLKVLRRPRVALFSTGDELIEPGQSPAYGQIYDSNSTTLHSLLNRCGCDVLDLGIIRDDENALDEAFRRAASADMIISTGGVSVGEADFVKDALQKHGDMQLWKIAIKPGKPLTFGKLHSGSLFFGLPGNPVSGVVTFALFVRPALNALQGEQTHDTISFRATSLDTLKKAAGRREFQRGVLHRNEDGHLQVSTTGVQESHILSSLHKANCFVVLAENTESVFPGDEVSVIPFAELGL